MMYLSSTVLGNEGFAGVLEAAFDGDDTERLDICCPKSVQIFLVISFKGSNSLSFIKLNSVTK